MTILEFSNKEFKLTAIDLRLQYIIRFQIFKVELHVMQLQ